MKYFLLLILTIIWLGCTGSKEMKKSDERAEHKVMYDESFDPLSLDDDDLNIPAVNLSSVQDKSGTLKDNNIGMKVLTKETNGFRVQIIATQDLGKATLLEEAARNKFSRFGHEAYLIFEAPLYKIRIGDFINRNKADELKDLVKKDGYREAFIVRTKVVVKENQVSDF